MAGWRLTAALALLLVSSPVFADGIAEEVLPAAEEPAPELTLAGMYEDTLLAACGEEVRSAYKACLKEANRTDFKGYCAMYVNRLLVHYGINIEYIKGDANKLYAIYSRMETTDGGYEIRLYPKREYSLSAALNAITAEDDFPRHILAVFNQGITAKGREFGHVVYINAIVRGKVVYSESAPYREGDLVIEQGEPLVCSIEEFEERYRDYKPDGVIWFYREGGEPIGFTGAEFGNVPPVSLKN